MMRSTKAPQVEIAQDGYTVVRVAGEIDFSNVAPFEDALNRAVGDSPSGFIIDLSRVTYFDSSGVAAMIGAYQAVYGRGKLAIVATNENVRSLLSLLHPEHLPGLFISDDIEKARQYLRAD